MNETIFYFFYNVSHQSVFFNGLIVFLADDLPYIFIGAAGVFYYGVFEFPEAHLDFIKKNKKIITVFFAGVTAWVLSVVLKILIHAERPFVVLPDVFPLFPETGFAFPSSHAAVFMALAVSIFFTHKKVGYIFIFFALLIGLARIIAGVHFPIDILGGFVLGLAAGALVAYFRKNV